MIVIENDFGKWYTFFNQLYFGNRECLEINNVYLCISERGV